MIFANLRLSAGRVAASRRTLLRAGLAAATLVPAGSHAADLAPAARVPAFAQAPFAAEPFFNEIRLGAYYHGIGNPERNTADVNVEILTRKIWAPENPDYAWLAPRLHAGGTLNTDRGTNYGYAGLTWTWNDVLIRRVFAEFSFGGSYNDGYTGRFAPFDRAKLGCNLLFRESGSLGYRLDEHWSVMATVEHISNGGLCDENRGITSAGLRLGYSF